MVAQDLHHLGAEGRAHVGYIQNLPRLLRVVQEIQHRGLEPGKAEVVRAPVYFGGRKAVCFRVACLRLRVQRDAAGIRHTHRTGGLVKALAGRVVPRAAEHGEIGIVVHLHEVAVSAGHDEAQKRRGQLRVRQIVSGNVSPQVVHRDQRKPGRHRQSLGEVDADQQRADQPRCRRDRDPVEVGKRHAGVRQRLVHHPRDRLRVAAARDLRHHAAVELMFLHLRRDHVAAHGAAVGHHRGGGLVTGGFNAEYIQPKSPP